MSKPLSTMIVRLYTSDKASWILNLQKGERASIPKHEVPVKFNGQAYLTYLIYMFGVYILKFN